MFVSYNCPIENARGAGVCGADKAHVPVPSSRCFQGQLPPAAPHVLSAGQTVEGSAELLIHYCSSDVCICFALCFSHIKHRCMYNMYIYVLLHNTKVSINTHTYMYTWVLVVCLTLLASSFLPSHLSLKHVYVHA